VVLLVNFNELAFNAVTNICTTNDLVDQQPIGTDNQQSWVKIKPISFNQSAVVLFLHEGERFGEAKVVFEEVINELLCFDARAAVLLCEEHGVRSRSRHSRLAEWNRYRNQERAVAVLFRGGMRADQQGRSVR